VVRTDRGGGEVVSEEARIPLDLVNRIRERVGAWRAAGYPGVTRVTRELIDHWNARVDRPLFFCQREAVETLIWLVEASAAERQGLDIPRDGSNGHALTRYCAKMATGSGKTVVMAMVAAWQILNRGVARHDARFSDAILVVGPNLTVKERLEVLKPQVAGNYYDAFELFPPAYRDLMSRGRVAVTNWQVFAVQDDSGKRSVVQRGRESPAAFARRVLQKELGDARNLLVMNDEAHHAWRPAPVDPATIDAELEDATAEEKRQAKAEAEEATIWVGGLDLIAQARGVRFVFDVSATPYYIQGSGYTPGTPLPWIVSDFGLVDAIESGITKVPVVVVQDDSGSYQPKYKYLWREIHKKLGVADREIGRKRVKPEAIWREASGALNALAGRWQQTFAHYQASSYPVPPVMIVVTGNTDVAQLAEVSIKRGDSLAALAGDATFRIDSRALEAAESVGEGDTKQQQQELLRLKTATVGKASWPDGRPPADFPALVEPPGKDVRCVVSVAMLTEGWDAQNVTQILGLRAFSSQLLCEQVVGRGLRRMSYDVGPDGLLVPEYCDVFGIPFEAIPVLGEKEQVARPQAPSNLVMALPDRAHLRIEFPRVDGYTVHVQRHLRCDVASLKAIAIHPRAEPTEVVVGAQPGALAQGTVGFGTITGAPQVVDREQYYREHRFQRTAFEIARDVTEVLAAGKRYVGKPGEDAASRLPAGAEVRQASHARLLFPQVLDVVRRYLTTRVVKPADKRIEELGILNYRQQIIENIIAGIEPDVLAGEDPILPRINKERPRGSTDDVMFRTTKVVRTTRKSHVSHVVCDSTWENEAAYHFELADVVQAYVKNDRLGFGIPYEWEGAIHTYIPDYLVRVAREGMTKTLVWEIKGLKDTQAFRKQQAAQKWCQAVNHSGAWGVWQYVLTDSLGQIRGRLRELAT
jgi:type III restriction enzyme